MSLSASDIARTSLVFSLEFELHYFANGKFAKLKFCSILDFLKYFNDSLYN